MSWDPASFGLGFLAGLVATLWLMRRRGRPDLIAPPPMPVQIPPDIAAKLRLLLVEDRRIEAIKLLRKRTGCDLVDAKNAVESFWKK